MCQNSPHRIWGLVMETKAIKFSIGTRVRKRTVFPLHAFFGITHWDSLDWGSPYVIPRSPDIPFYYTFVYMLFSWVCDLPRDVCIRCCAYLMSYYSTVVIFTPVQNSRCTYVIGTMLLLSMEYYTLEEYGDMMLLYGEARPSTTADTNVSGRITNSTE